jgi:hypothetical protein
MTMPTCECNAFAEHPPPPLELSLLFMARNIDVKCILMWRDNFFGKSVPRTTGVVLPLRATCIECLATFVRAVKLRRQ